MTLQEKEDLKSAISTIRQIRNNSKELKDEQFYECINTWLTEVDDIYNMLVTTEVPVDFYESVKKYFLTKERSYLTLLETYERATRDEEVVKADAVAKKEAKERSDAILKEVLEETKA